MGRIGIIRDEGEQCMDGGRSVEQKYETGCVSAISGVNLH